MDILQFKTSVFVAATDIVGKQTCEGSLCALCSDPFYNRQI